MHKVWETKGNERERERERERESTNRQQQNICVLYAVKKQSILF